MQQKGVRFRALLEGGNMVNIKSLAHFVCSLSGIIMNTTRKVHAKVSTITLTNVVFEGHISTELN